MAVTVNDNVYILDTAGDEMAFAFECDRIRWVGSTTAGDNLDLTQSSIGSISRRVWETLSVGDNNIEESLNGFYLSQGLRIDVIDAGELWVYVANRRR